MEADYQHSKRSTKDDGISRWLNQNKEDDGISRWLNQNKEGEEE